MLPICARADGKASGGTAINVANKIVAAVRDIARSAWTVLAFLGRFGSRHSTETAPREAIG
jgi:hypothetical protein